MTRLHAARAPLPAWLRRLLGEPFCQFLALGALIFIVHGQFATEAGTPRIDIDAEAVQRLSALAEKQWGKPATGEELQRLVQEQVREEVLYREALALGLEVDDVIVRRRLVQKMEFLAQSDVPLPSEDEVQAFYQEHPERYGAPDQLSFRQLYFQDAAAAEQALEKLRSNPAAAVASARLMLPERFVAQSQEQVARDFGDAFAAQLFSLPLGQWRGPLRSPLGLHLLLIEQRAPAGLLEYATIRDKVAADLTNQRQQQARDAAYEVMRGRYQVSSAPLAAVAAP